MQVTIDKKTGIFLGIIAVLLAAMIGLVGFGHHSHDAHEMDHGSMHGSMNGPMHDDMNADSSMVGSDVMFLQMMIPHHQQAVDISNLAISRSNDAELVALATTIRDGQMAEITQMKGWLTASGDALTPPHAMGDGTGGMVSEADLATLKSLSGKAFDVSWLQKMIAHHEGAIHMVMMIHDSPKGEMRTFGGGIDDVQSAQIKQMNAMLSRLGA
jgi:uncharacterized protein (DUF305 family)